MSVNPINPIVDVDVGEPAVVACPRGFDGIRALSLLNGRQLANCRFVPIFPRVNPSFNPKET